MEQIGHHLAQRLHVALHRWQMVIQIGIDGDLLSAEDSGYLGHHTGAIIDVEAEEDDNRAQLQTFSEYNTRADWVWVPTLTWSPDSRFVAAVVHGSPIGPEALEDSQVFIDAAKAFMVDKSGTLQDDPVEKFFLTELQSWMPVTNLGARMRKTPAGVRLYVDLVRDRLLYMLRGSFVPWHRLENTYASGNYRAAADIIASKLTSSDELVNALAFKSFTHRIPVRISNIGSAKRTNWPITLAVKDIKATAWNFNPDNCAVVVPERWIDWLQIPHQVDEIDPAVGKELSFLVDVELNESSIYYIYYSPLGKSQQSFPYKTGTAEDWLLPTIGWESNRIAYRSYWGYFEFFGKKVDRLILNNLGSKSYHKETDWGIDALHIGGTSSGLGGLTLYVSGRPYTLQMPEGKGNLNIEKHVLTSGPVRAAIELNISNLAPDKPDLSVRVRGTIYAERQETKIQLAVSGEEQDIIVAPGITKLNRENIFLKPDIGYFGSWGVQQPVVIGEIGLGLVFSSDAFVRLFDKPTERQLQLRPSADGRLRYWLLSDWRRGRQHPIAPTVENWEKEVKRLSKLLLNDVKAAIGPVEKVQ